MLHCHACQSLMTENTLPHYMTRHKYAVFQLKNHSSAHNWQAFSLASTGRVSPDWEQKQRAQARQLVHDAHSHLLRANLCCATTLPQVAVTPSDSQPSRSQISHLTKITTSLNKKKRHKVSKSSFQKALNKSSSFLFNRFVPCMPPELYLLTFLADNVFTTFCSCYHSTGKNTILAEWEWDSSPFCRRVELCISVLQPVSEQMIK